jgi:hypothetical protein
VASVDESIEECVPLFTVDDDPLVLIVVDGADVVAEANNVGING